MDNNVEIKKRKRGSKNRKKAWKTVDVEDVEQHLEDVRRDERTGYVFIQTLCLSTVLFKIGPSLLYNSRK